MPRRSRARTAGVLRARQRGRCAPPAARATPRRFRNAVRTRRCRVPLPGAGRSPTPWRRSARPRHRACGHPARGDPPMTTRPIPLVLFLLATACAAPAIEESNAYPELMTAMTDLQAEQQRFAATTVLPQTFKFPGQGRVVARIVSLDGYPGNTYVRCRFHYFNDTGRPVARSLVSLDVLDGAGRMVASQVSVCIFPTPRAIYDGTFYADELRTQTHGVHVQPGWSWRVTCKSEFMDEVDEHGDPVK